MAKMRNVVAAALLIVAALATGLDAPRAQDGDSAEDVFHDHISGPIVQSRCVNCHVDGGLSGHTRLVLARSTEADHEALNLRAFEDLLDAVENEGGANYVLNKIQGVAHGGSVQVPAGSPGFASMQRFLSLLGRQVATASLTPQTLFDTVVLAPHWKTLRRAALIFAGRIPTEAEYAAVQGGDETALRSTIRGLMRGPEFHEFLIRGSNDRLLTERDNGGLIDASGYFVDHVDETYRRKKAAMAIDDEEAWHRFNEWGDRVDYGARQAPLELIAYVAKNDLPYTEILTADYVMANPMAAKAYGASTFFRDPTDPNEFRPSRIAEYYRVGEETVIEYDPDVDAHYVVDPGPLHTRYPHAGILNTLSFLRRYPTTATNRNRARARWTYYHFLGLDVEKSASRTTDPVALADTNNPTMQNPACTVCHSVMDPVAGAFQNYDEEGLYKSQWGGVDSLDELYKYPEEEAAFVIEADSWAERQTFSVTAWLQEDSRLMLRHLNNNWCNDEECGTYDRDFRLDDIAVRDLSGGLVHRVQWATLDEHCMYDGEYIEGTGANDHYQWWGWDCETIPVELPRAATYLIEVVAWADRSGDELAQMAFGPILYQEGDIWYRDMRVPGFAGAAAPDADNSLQWLAQHIVADPRYAEAAVRFWWPAIMGSEVAPFPEDERDADFEGLLLAANAQNAEITRLAEGFRDGFPGSSYTYNLKDLLTEIVLTKWFRADALTDADPVRRTALRDAGARRLLTPEELAHKTAAITGYQWGRDIRTDCFPKCDPSPNALTLDYRLLYGGIDSDGITERARDLTSVMAGVAKRHAVETGCAVVLRDFYFLPDTQRWLFAGIRLTERGAGAVKAKLVDLHEKLFGIRVTADSTDVEAAYQLFVEVSKRRARAELDWFDWGKCNLGGDVHFFRGILDDAVVQYEDDYGWRWYELDWERIHEFMSSRDFPDTHHTAQAWVMVLTAMMMDYRYLYL